MISGRTVLTPLTEVGGEEGTDTESEWHNEPSAGPCGSDGDSDDYRRYIDDESHSLLSFPGLLWGEAL